MFKARRLQETDYDNLIEWWRYFRFPAPAREFLPENGTCGLIIHKEGIDICAGFIYFTNSKIAWIEFIVSNPEYKDKNRQEAIKILIRELGVVIKNKGYKAIYTSLKNPNLIKHFKAEGFSVGSSNTVEMIISL
ncbi:hypothetical protein [Flavobacterium sp. HSC-61S13]|uniref:hypothetical protein n=1 Tax=Flavobacterium sp. HSC-61S13 TaxID=2910963 RepID=UPI00209FCF06|nr:hypothetical protein [Flavobacterium sp. HSC-61S13]MCP1996649.1 hypothetical protein [Flavobacterium sp. HSC-61S13]